MQFESRTSRSCDLPPSYAHLHLTKFYFHIHQHRKARQVGSCFILLPPNSSLFCHRGARLPPGGQQATLQRSLTLPYMAEDQGWANFLAGGTTQRVLKYDRGAGTEADGWWIYIHIMGFVENMCCNVKCKSTKAPQKNCVFKAPRKD